MNVRKILQRLRKPAHLQRRENPDETHIWSVGKSSVTTGRFTYTGRITVHQWGEGANLSFGSFCSIAEGLTVILGGNHRLDWCTTFPFGHIFQNELGGRSIPGHPATKGNIEVGNDVWLGLDVTLLSGVVIGDGAVVAAKSVVTRSIGPYEIWGGNPAKKIADRFPREITDALLALRWWDLPTEKVKELAPLLSQSPTIELLERARAIARNHGNAVEQVSVDNCPV